ncbi:hypothetical protein GG804_24965 [Sphingomonas histidinilytica]|uniref:hypothetical protein n=1 Tax=Rhizorhabdus histidinilytica TaxID=439228 RepID=UPI001ADBFBDB|nr:hypothetical protein [Rhizorhabdus histidinilytica]MBO9380023.1 hypothetical protein [Rhizorhabdus histidinilytica]
MSVVTSRPATAGDIAFFYPNLCATVRAWIIELDGIAVGVIGIALSRPSHSIFSTFDEALRPHLRSMAIMRTIKRLEGYVERARGPVLAVRERNERQSVHILKRLGFRFYAIVDGDAVYRYEGGAHG